MKNSLWRTVVEMAFIIFLFYSNLLMGEYMRSGNGLKYGVMWAIEDIVTVQNFLIALVSSFIGHHLFAYIRRRTFR